MPERGAQTGSLGTDCGNSTLLPVAALHLVGLLCQLFFLRVLPP